MVLVTGMTAPLAGIRVLEVANWLAAPAAGALLVDNRGKRSITVALDQPGAGENRPGFENAAFWAQRREHRGEQVQRRPSSPTARTSARALALDGVIG